MYPISLNSLKEIRIIINMGKGFGHQAASITLMKDLRAKGFCGIYDIYYREIFPTTQYGTYIVGSTGKNLETLIPGFKARELNNSTISQDILELYPIGLCRINRLPENLHLVMSHTQLTMTAADDTKNPYNDNLPNKFNSELYIGLQPTNWKGERFIQTAASMRMLSKDLRLSRESIVGRPLKLDDLTWREKQILSLCQNENILPQVCYSLLKAKNTRTDMYSRDTMDFDPAIQKFIIMEREETFISPEQILERLVLAHSDITQDKITILLCPEDVTKEVFASYREKYQNPTGIFLDLTTNPEFDASVFVKGAIIIVYTGRLKADFFEYLLLNTILPPVVEGCNSVEICELKGRTFLRGGCSENIKIYPTPEEYNALKTMHYMASEYLNRNVCLEVSAEALIEYMTLCLQTNPHLSAYHASRAKCIEKMPDAIATAFEEAGVSYIVESIVENKTLFDV